MACLLARHVAFALPAGMSHSRTVPAASPDANSLPSPVKAKALTEPGCPARVARRTPVRTSHNSTTPMLHAAASSLPSGLKATPLTPVPLASKTALALSARHIGPDAAETTSAAATATQICLPIVLLL
jgi:hypothetical protein